MKPTASDRQPSAAPFAPVAVVGAGPSGLAAAYLLRSHGCPCRVYEKSRGVSGRAASRSREGCRYDHGANYFTAPEGHDARQLFEGPLAEGLSELEGAILPFAVSTGADGEGAVDWPEPDPARGAEAKWTYADGISGLGKRLVAAGGLEVRHGVRVASLERDGGGAWTLRDAEGRGHGPYRTVLVTAPAPQAAELLSASDLDASWREPLVAALADATYVSQHSAVANFGGEARLPRDAYALVNVDRRHEIAWVGHENRKPGRVPVGQSLFVIQMSPDWTRRHWDSDPQELGAAATAALRRLAGGALCEAAHPLRWTDAQRWRYALPARAVDPEVLSEAASRGLHFAGDGLVGKGRVAGALESGLAAARRLLGGAEMVFV